MLKSFEYFQLGLIYYYISIINNLSKTEVKKKINQNFDIIEEVIFKNKDPLVFTFYNTLPYEFLPLPLEYQYYYSYASFINKDFEIDNIKNFIYEDINLNIEKPNIYYSAARQDMHIFPYIKNIMIPLKYYNKFIEDDMDILIICEDLEAYIVDKNMKSKYKFNNSKFKNIMKFKPYVKHEEIINKQIKYLFLLKPITKKQVNDIFPTVTIPKGTYLYHSRSDDLTPNIIRTFYAIYPKINMIDPFELFPADYHCFLYRTTKDLEAVNLNKNTFFEYRFDGKHDDSGSFEFYDTTKIYGERKIKSKLFDCIGDNLENRLNCDFNDIKDYGTQKTFNNNIMTWRRNLGKRYLYLLINKTKKYIFPCYYYMDFLQNYEYKSFVYHYGKFKNKFLDAELAIIDRTGNYIEYLDMKKGECQKIYKELGYTKSAKTG